MNKPDLFRRAEQLMSMDSATWARHGNPLSVWSRILSGPIVFLALWSPFWISWWGGLVILVTAGWIWLNPRLFSPPCHTKSWATQIVLGERVFLNRKNVPIPDHHRRAGMVTTLCAIGFMMAAGFGFLNQSFWLALVGWHAAIMAKIWFCDRMAWLWQDMKMGNEQYRRWNEADWAES